MSTISRRASEPLPKNVDFVVDQSRPTRATCLTILFITYAISIPLLGTGIGLLVRRQEDEDIDVIILPTAFAEIIPLFINLVSTVLMEGLGLIHTTTLKWCLQREGRLVFSSNLRLFTASRTSLPNGRVANFLNAFFTIITYASASLIFVKVLSSQQIQAEFQQTPSQAYENSVAISFLAIILMSCGLLGQALLATWAYTSVSVPTWSSSPITTTLACMKSTSSGYQRQHHRSLRSVGDSPGQEPQSPRKRQKPAWKAHHGIRMIVRWFWMLFGLISAWWIAVIAAIYTIKQCEINPSAPTFCPIQRGSRSGWFPMPDIWGTSPFVLIRIVFDVTAYDPVTPFAFFIVIVGFQAFLTLGLHCLNLLVSVAIDEDIWRTTTSEAGYGADFNSIKNMTTSWKYLTIFVCKPIVHWLYGLGMTYTYGLGILPAGIVMRPAQLMYLSLFVLIIAGGATLVAKRGREGPQPVTFGHLQTIIDLVDDWQSELHWGHKAEDVTTGLCMAGTSSQELPNIMMEKMYY